LSFTRPLLLESANRCAIDYFLFKRLGLLAFNPQADSFDYFIFLCHVQVLVL